MIVFSICSDQNLTQFCGFQWDKSERIAFFQSDFMGMSVTILFAIRKESKLSFCFRKKERRRGSFGAVMRQLYNIDGGALPLLFDGIKHFFFRFRRHVAGKDHRKIPIAKNTSNGMRIGFLHRAVADRIIAVKGKTCFFLCFMGHNM